MNEEISGKISAVGTRRCMKLIESGNAQKAFIAGDVEPHMLHKILDACKANGVLIELVQSKAELGKICRIEVDASVAVIAK